MTRPVYSIDELLQLFKSKKLSPIDHLEENLAWIEEVNPTINAFTYIDYEGARRAAHLAHENFQKGIVKSPLQGVTVAVKDVIQVKDMPITMQTELYSNKPIIPSQDAYAVKKLREAGAVIVGKLNTHEMGMGPTGDVGFNPHAKNAYDLSKVTGGSSSGSAAAIAANLVDVTLGSDTGGSIRLPSALSANYGMKPTFGRVSNTGFMPLSYSCDAIGPMTHSVKDNAYVLQTISAYDPENMYSKKLSTDLIPRGILNPSEYTIGVTLGWSEEKLNPEIRHNYHKVVGKLESMGFKILDVNETGLLPSRAELDRLRQHHQRVLISEGFHAHQEEIKGKKFNQGIYDRLQTGNTKTIDYVNSYQEKHKLIAMYRQLYSEVDLLLTPAVMTPACDLYQTEVEVEGELYSTMKVYTEFTWLDSFSGNPSMTIPSGFTDNGLPLGVLINGPYGKERKIYDLALSLEEELDLDLSNNYKK